MNLHRAKQDFFSILAQQSDFISKSTALLVQMLDSSDVDEWKRFEREIKSCEVQGDALLTEFHEMLSGRWILKVNKLDLQAVSMAMDDCIDVIKDTAKAILIYHPERIDPQLKDLAQIARSQSEAIAALVRQLKDIKKNLSSISTSCERVTELEHTADEAYEDYIGFIFRDVSDVRELIKYKNLSEMLENATDAHKKISDNVRKLLLNYLSD
ncbi:MAG: DUF47 family protein [Bacteroidales bacterium]|nr:DUF47 family protein [Bacteroidales bacterium]